jgi:REP-associated tyrosine transposase
MITYKDDCIYHIYNRGKEEELVFFNDSNYKSLIRKMIHNYERYDVSIIAFCLMPNHYHLLLRQNPEGSISEFLETVFSAFSKTVKKEQEISGDLFDFNPKAVEIKNQDVLQKLIWYIHHNPLKATLVRRIDNWKFSNFPECVGMRNAFPCDESVINKVYGSTEEYKKYTDKSKDDKFFVDVEGKFLIDG